MQLTWFVAMGGRLAVAGSLSSFITHCFIPGLKPTFSQILPTTHTLLLPGAAFSDYYWDRIVCANRLFAFSSLSSVPVKLLLGTRCRIVFDV